MTQKVSLLTKGEMLDAIKSHLNMNKNAEFARFLGISSQAVSNWYSRNTFDAELLYTKCDFINPDWLLTGRGSMQKREEVSLMGDKDGEKDMNSPEVNYEHKGAPYYNVDFIGGFDVVLNDQTRNPDYYIDFAPYNKEGVVWCNITGHSMEPELNNGDFIAMREMHDPIEYLPYGEIYGIVTDSYRTVKRIRMAERDGFVRLIPTNKSPEYGEQEIPVSMIRKVYAVLGSMHRLF